MPTFGDVFSYDILKLCFVLQNMLLRFVQVQQLKIAVLHSSRTTASSFDVTGGLWTCELENLKLGGISHGFHNVEQNSRGSAGATT